MSTLPGMLPLADRLVGASDWGDQRITELRSRLLASMIQADPVDRLALRRRWAQMEKYSLPGMITVPTRSCLVAHSTADTHGSYLRRFLRRHCHSMLEFRRSPSAAPWSIPHLMSTRPVGRIAVAFTAAGWILPLPRSRTSLSHIRTITADTGPNLRPS